MDIKELKRILSMRKRLTEKQIAYLRIKFQEWYHPTRHLAHQSKVKRLMAKNSRRINRK